MERSESEEKVIEGVMTEVGRATVEVETFSVEVTMIESASQYPEKGTEIPSEETETTVQEKVTSLEEGRRRTTLVTISTPSLHLIAGHAAV